ncbi:hypothetical protein [Rhizobium lusitanum]|uniref:hypothetical protein n=1 Tax=Rhizobium lusitanum TaxID=293958 RepID=UPI001FEF3599|nr:hypothetical protein [Rhizobium lusitanum]
MKISLTIAKNLLTQTLLEQKEIPCLSRISGREFEISFIDPLPVACGKVSDWDGRKINERAPAYGGGSYTHDCFGKVSLAPIDGGKYEIVDLSFFNRAVGWCPIIINGEYGPIGSFWDEEE